MSDTDPRAPRLHSPAADVLETSRIGRYVRWLAEHRGLEMSDYDQLHHWSVTDLDGFWSSLWEFFGIRAHEPYDAVLGRREMPGAEWFPGARLNYAEHALGDLDTGRDAQTVAVVAHSQTRPPITLTFGDLRTQVAAAQAGLRRLGVGRGDRVAAYLPNIPETLVAFLATAGLGATWAACAPEFGPRSVVDRFGQIEPKVLLVVSGYAYGDHDVDRQAEIAAIRAGLPSLEHVVHVPYGGSPPPDSLEWGRLLAEPGELSFASLPFAHPLCVLFSSGTTGKPKAIVHGHGGILIEHLKNNGLSWDLGPGDRMLWFSTTAWMMWNALVSGLLTGASIVMIDGDPTYPDLRWQWQLAAQTGATLMGASPGFLMACRRQGVRPAAEFDLSRLRQLGAAGSPLPAEGYYWVRDQFGPDVLLNVGSGGTDVCTGIVQGSVWQPVWAGEISGSCLGVAAKAFDQKGEPVVGELGELVITEPMPSMPVGFWGDPDGRRYRSTYFDHYPGIWRHGDWIRFSETGSCSIAGRSDATLNRGGVRLGTAEFYEVLEEVPEVADSLVVHLESPSGGNGELMLFVELREGAALDASLRSRLSTTLRTLLSPRHVPDTITAVPAVPHTRTGKKLELPVKRILQGARPEDVASRDALSAPGSLDPYVALAQARERR